MGLVEFYSVTTSNFIKELIIIINNLLPKYNNKIDLVVTAEELEQTNLALWSLNPFFPHCLYEDKHAQNTPVVLYNANNYTIGNNYVILLNNADLAITLNTNLSIVFNALEENYLSYNRNRYKLLNADAIKLKNNNIK